MVELFNRYDQSTQPPSLPEWLYRFLSGHAHGREWAMLRCATEVDLDGFDTGMNMIRVDLTLQCHLGGLGTWVGGFGKRGEDVGGLVHPAALFTGIGERFAQRGPEAQPDRRANVGPARDLHESITGKVRPSPADP